MPEANETESHMGAADELLFAPEQVPTEEPTEPWKVLIVDDDEEIHQVTKLALANMRFAGRPLRFLDAYTGREGVALMRRNQDVAMVLMDVVMEDDDAGLRAIDRIRNELGNHQVRIVLRTGQPGQAPEHDVVTRYDINDYKEKTELTAKKLFTLTYTGLSLYQDLCSREQRQGYLRDVIRVSNTIFRRRTPTRLCKGILKELGDLLGAGREFGSTDGQAGAFAVSMVAGAASPIVAAIGCFRSNLGESLQEAVGSFAVAALERQDPDRRWQLRGETLTAQIRTEDGMTTAFYLKHADLQIRDEEIVDLYFENAAIALNNAYLSQQIETTQKEMVLMLGEAIEKRSKETGNHVRRVGEIARMLAQLSGLSEEESTLLAIAAPLHDAGKIAIPDAILNKPGPHTEEETAVMRTHAEMGSNMFRNSGLPALQSAAVIAEQHHERWDGGGYPKQLKGSQIHIFGRITAIADVFDAMCSKRCYKEAWSVTRARAAINEERGGMFDPKLVDLFDRHFDQVLAIRQRYPDQD